MTKKVNITTGAGADAASINEAVAARIKRYRAEKKISLDELSRRAGVSKGMLVDIEACRANPSIALLCRLASAMGVAVADFVNVASAPPVKAIAAGDIPTLWQGEQGGHARLLAGTSGPDMVELWQWSLYPGEIFTSPGHGEGTTELLFVTEGALTLTVNDSLYLIPAGDSAVARTDAQHSYANAGETVTRFTMTVSEKAR
ncbi:helix-turn-helix domain-containing protein [Klebsiella oxytoca]|uniref:helix-turn-helix domain-containing protein n=1 Tax=Klebsiella oxytoca TaxID=571 RepID=UPI00066B3FC0|nr:XRE family transcriptional regulator [Klebsiella oxytoca]EJA2380257.1 helix-turn-helix transcriptional regulator [Klebsiella oxytoca]EJZ8298541.1 helix-turn-helix transcriptional regulator [Klebsiella oxytoca]EKM0800596.1 helix-turn-helix transcriptional regulator [Klebsiella oxytoca]EKT7903089.1 helix-turn-helix transcriptional regulator [Klebsiella oxytoca]ELI3676126.1 helix-turn-helix transcriptional regulator [Klebsiella oxytoca]